MNLIFVDFDGVLNSHKSKKENSTKESLESIFERRFHIEIENLKQLQKLTQQTQAQLIISSTWRKDKYFIEHAQSETEIIQKFKDKFNEYGWSNAPIMGITPNLSGFRGEEVAIYLDNIAMSLKFKNIHYAIIDDDSDFIVCELKDLPMSKLDRFGIRSEEDLESRSMYWSNQNLFKINSENGLTKIDVDRIVQYFSDCRITSEIAPKIKLK